MNELTFLYAGVAVLAGVISSISVWSPRRFGLKLSAIGASGLFLPAAYLGFVALLGQPKPVQLEWLRARAPEATVLASSFRENQAIYVWLQLNDVAEPRAYAIPWSRDLAEQLQTAQRQAAENQTQVQMRMPFEPSLEEREPKFYAMPQPQLPPKTLDQAPAQVYRRQATNS
jgi:hypothetical protein